MFFIITETFFFYATLQNHQIMFIEYIDFMSPKESTLILSLKQHFGYHFNS